MDKTSNGLNAAAAYDLACRYGNLFQYNPAAAVACAAAYGNMFNANGVVSKHSVSSTIAPVSTTFSAAKNTTSNNTNSVSSPTNSSASSSSSNANNNSNSSSSSLNNVVSGLRNVSGLVSAKSNKIEEEEKEEEDEETNKEEIANKTFESVSDEINNSIKFDADDDMLEEENASLANHLKDLNAKTTDKKSARSATHSRSSSISSMNSAASSTGSSFIVKDDENCNNDTENEEDEDFNQEISEENNEVNISNNNNTEAIQDELVEGTKKAIENCFDSDEAPVDGDEYEDDLERTPSKKQCTNSSEDKVDAASSGSQQQASLGSILDSLTARCSPSHSSPSSSDHQTVKLAKKVDDLKTKLSAKELISFKEELISSVNVAIQATFKKFFGPQIEQQPKETLKTEVTPPVDKLLPQLQQQQHPKRPLAPPSHNFSMSNLLNNNHHHNQKKTGVRVGDINKRKLSTSSHYKPYQQEMAKQQAKYHQALIETKPRINTHQIGSTPSHSSSSSASSSSNHHHHKQHSMVNQLYTAALSHLQSTSKNASIPPNSFNMNTLVNNTNNHNSINNNPNNTSPFPVTPSQYHPSLLTSNQPPANMSSIFSHNHQHQQFLMSAAAAAAAQVGQNSQVNPHHSGPNASYFNNMAAAANRLFTPYLLEHHTAPQPNQPLISTPNAGSKIPQRTPNSYQSSTPSMFSHMPGKRRRTKVTDTRLSPRNTTSSASLRSTSLLQMSASNSLSGLNGHGSGNIANNKHSIESNDNDDQENYNQDFDDNSHKFMGSNQDESETGANNMQVNDEDSMSDFNDQNGGQLATMPNGCFSSSIFLKNDSQSGDGHQQMVNRDSNISMDISATNEYNGYQTATLSSLHLRKAKLMFFFSRYPSSTILRNYFPDVKFNKANTAQLVKWFSNFREFFYIQMEKYARQHLAEGIQHADELHVDMDSEIFRALNSHYNRNNQLEIPQSFCYVIEATLKEFFNSIQEGKDLDPSWKKAIYKVIARMDDTIPEFFKSIKWMETLESSI